MEQGTLTIYSASAGSGKTFRLAGAYLAKLFKSRYNYRRILAVTFTNKATAEMKDRILDQLHNLATGSNSEYLQDLMKTTGMTEKNIRTEAGLILFSILHDFSRFSVCTIDSFFQKVLRAFARESGLQSGFSVELDHSLILSDATGQMIASASSDGQLKMWLTDFVLSNLDEEKSWNLKGEILKLGEELFKEKFKILSANAQVHLEDKDFLLDYIKSIRSISVSFRKTLKSCGEECMRIYSEFRLSDDMFYQKGRGIPAFLRKLALGAVPVPGNSVFAISQDPPRWSTGNPSPELLQAREGGLEKNLVEVLRYYRDNIIRYNSAEAVLENIYTLGILTDVLDRVRHITTSENSFLLSDAAEFLSLITNGDQTPFIYEKIGNRYENYMIDEFQDTSILQWNNFRPLMENSMGEGYDNLVVGDVKQSIYRFRNSDWKILNTVRDETGNNTRIRSLPLKTNFRSRSGIIRFNNTLFSIIPELADRLLSEDQPDIKFGHLYSEAVQLDPGRKSGGYVRLEFIGNETKDKEANSEVNGKGTGKWKEIVLEKLPLVIESFQDKGYNASDIGILVRDGREGAEVLETMIRYANNCDPDRKRKYNYNVISNDSLILSRSPVIIFIISVLKVLVDRNDLIARAQLLRFYFLATGKENAETGSIPGDLMLTGSETVLPEGYDRFLEKAGHMTLFEAIESIAGFFGLGNYPWNVSYLSTFQDLVLNFSIRKNTDFQSFLDWWDSTGSSKSVILPANQDAARVLTIHKSKGLEFRIVILPFLSWGLDHRPNHPLTLWVQPAAPPFDSLGIVPVKYKKSLVETIFAGDYKKELFSAYLDNVNLLYVAMTRAIDALHGFIPGTPGQGKNIAGLLREALATGYPKGGSAVMDPGLFFDKDSGVFEYGEIPENRDLKDKVNYSIPATYSVNNKPGSLKLRLHGENYFTKDRQSVVQKINYGRLMHEVFMQIDTYNDIKSSVEKLVLDGLIPVTDSKSIIDKLEALMGNTLVKEWFNTDIRVLKETDILLPSGLRRRPDRIIFKDNKVVIVDFKFGKENDHYTVQLREYKKLLNEMGYMETEAFIWYVELDKIISI